MRNQTVDIAKGVAGMMVVLGHAMAFRYDRGVLLHLSHLTTPIFIFLAGVFIKTDRSFGDSIKRKLDSLLKPYLSTSILVGGLFFSRGHFDAVYFLAGVLYATGPTVALFAIWFIPHFFVCVLVGVWLMRWLESPTISAAVRWLTVVMLVLVGQKCLPLVWQLPLPSAEWRSLLRPSQHWPGLPWSLDALPLTLAFLLSGRWLSQSVRAFHCNGWLAFLSLVVLLVGAGLDEALLDINGRVYRDVIVTSLFVAAGIYGTLSLSALIKCNHLFARCFSYVGENFLFILCVHVLVLQFVFHCVESVVLEWHAWYIAPVFLLSFMILLLLTWIVRRYSLLSLFFFPVMAKEIGQ